VVESLAANGTQNELLVNAFGAYSGTVLFDINIGEHSVAFKIEATASWTIIINPVGAARAWDTTKTLTGTDDDVVRLSPPAAGLTPITVIGSGTGNFIVQTYGLDRANTIFLDVAAPYSGEVPLPDLAALLVVNADASWSIAAQ
jgi:hypothetical protein